MILHRVPGLEIEVRDQILLQNPTRLKYYLLSSLFAALTAARSVHQNSAVACADHAANFFCDAVRCVGFEIRRVESGHIFRGETVRQFENEH